MKRSRAESKIDAPDAAPEAITPEHPEWKKLELLVAEIQRELTPGAVVTHNAKLLGRTGTERQIDVLVEQQIGQFHIRIVFDCKDYIRPADVKCVEAFIGLVEDVGAHKGSIVAPRGFTSTAKKRAKHADISLFDLVDTSPHKWQSKVQLPALCDFREARIGFKISCRAPMPFMLMPDFLTTLEAFDDEGTALGTPLRAALTRWDAGRYSPEVGEHDGVPLHDTLTVQVDNGYGQRIPVDLSIHYAVTRRRFCGHLGLAQVRGLRDVDTGLLHANGFTTEGIDPSKVEGQWTQLKEGEDPAGPVAIEFMGLVGHRLEDDPRNAPGYDPFGWKPRQ